MMIIKTPRSKPLALIDALLTALAWGVFCYLLAAGMVSLLASDAPDTSTLTTVRLLPLLHTLMIYLIVAISIAAMLLVWAQYNAHYFGGRDRRKTLPAVLAESLANQLGISAAQLLAVQESRRIVIHHLDDGSIYAIDTDTQSVRHHKLRVIA